ncbi:biopolymer transporter ExbD [Oceanicella actignis]|uniref:Biopolymer transport protein ExbD n=1 Tax=Oceanicella actignis TaxID=1189325 RepID=A0A1M7SFE3_9RHOB|nr:biopolymer transporter ExbD [Oceanicella actignis]TYO91307.1 biopolymer transport protein ExbD [Oceanicella actignis]SET22526.1 outer membrane transport energization protein ExbD (TC 2.C.1.1.1) [Oceanicella actignis]SHN57183.1 biopolymer transport protein ExbD [Oceanicella actignis]
MDLNESARRPRRESIVPMINVVFLLLVFFLTTSQLTRPEPFETTPPRARTDAQAEAEAVVFVSRDGRIAFDGHEGAQAIAALAGPGAQGGAVRLRADAALEARRLAAILRELSEAGLSRVELVVAPK